MFFRRRPRFTFDDLAAAAERARGYTEAVRKKTQAGATKEELAAAGYIRLVPPSRGLDMRRNSPAPPVDVP
jgi:hypothetical protein